MGNVCGGEEQEPPNPDQIDLTHFDLLKVVGKGGFGKVNAIQRRDSSHELCALKRMAKAAVIKKESHLRMVWTERNIMCAIGGCPFLVHLYHAFQTPTELLFVMPFMQGGDLRYHLSQRGPIPESECQFYAAELLLAIEHMHKKQIAYRDLKPDNILLDAEGHIRLSDFGLAVQLDQQTGFFTRGNAGTQGYLAPEVIFGEKYGCPVDAWAFGVTIYELLHGRRPFRQLEQTPHQQIQFYQQMLQQQQQQMHHRQQSTASYGVPSYGDLSQQQHLGMPPSGLHQRSVSNSQQAFQQPPPSPQHAAMMPPTHMHNSSVSQSSPTSIKFSPELSNDAKSLIKGLLLVDPTQRYGSPANFHNYSNGLTGGGWNDVKQHPWFASINWDALEAKRITPPFAPDTTQANCSNQADLADQLIDKKPEDIPDSWQVRFEGFEYNVELPHKDGTSTTARQLASPPLSPKVSQPSSPQHQPTPADQMQLSSWNAHGRRPGNDAPHAVHPVKAERESAAFASLDGELINSMIKPSTHTPTPTTTATLLQQQHHINGQAQAGLRSRQISQSQHGEQPITLPHATHQSYEQSNEHHNTSPSLVVPMVPSSYNSVSASKLISATPNGTLIDPHRITVQAKT